MVSNSDNRNCRGARAGLCGLLRRYIGDRRGNISVMVALMIVPLVGILGVATETSSWFMVQRGMQNAADAAAIAAATNTDVNTYALEAKSVTSNFGFANGVNNTTVTVINTDNSVPAVCHSACYKVTITRNIPIYLSRIVGYSGTVALGGGRAQTVSTFAVASPQNVPTTYCLLSLGPGDGFHVNGGKNVDLHGCNVRSNGDVTCNGSNSNGGAANIIFTGTNKKCDPSTKAGAPLADPYSSQAALIPANNCPSPNLASSYPQEASGLHTKLSGNITLPAVKIYCGDVQLTGDVNLTTASPGTVMVIENGDLDVGSHTLKTLAGSGLTVVFTGPTIAGFSPTHILAGGGDMNIAAPTSGSWSGFAIYQDPALAAGAGVDMSAAGNSPTWDISGLIYVPNSSLSFSGSVNKAANGFDCFVLVDYEFQTNGTGDILENQSQCAQAGVNLPSDSAFIRASLVL